MLNITYIQRITNVYIHEEMISRIGSYYRVLQKVKRRKISLFGHVSRHDTLENTILQGRVEGKEVDLKGIGWTMSMSGPVCLLDLYFL